MIVRVDDDLAYVIYFTKIPHKTTKRSKTDPKKMVEVTLIDTMCTIKIFKDVSLAKGTVVCSATVKQYIGDKYDKVLGKKLALDRALQTPDAREWFWQALSEEGAKLNKECRTKIWNKFRETFGQWPKDYARKNSKAEEVENADVRVRV